MDNLVFNQRWLPAGYSVVCKHNLLISVVSIQYQTFSERGRRECSFPGRLRREG